MKRQIPWLGLLALASAVLFVVVGVLWVSSYFVEGWVPVFRAEARHLYVGTGKGAFVLKHHAIESRDQHVRLVRHVAELVDPGPVNTIGVTVGENREMVFIVGHRPLAHCWWYRINWANLSEMKAGRTGQPLISVTTRADEITMSYALPLLALAIAPALGCIQRRRIRQRMRRGHCRVCGYDLRATPDRCPECGTAA